MVQGKKQLNSKPKFAEVVIGDNEAKEMRESAKISSNPQFFYQKFGNFGEISYLCNLLELIKRCNMNIRVIIDKLGPIQKSEIEFKPFLVYTGESGLGKSYTALLWYNLLTAMTSERLSEFIRMKSNGSQKDELTLKFKDFRTWINQNTSAFLGYLLGNTNFD